MFKMSKYLGARSVEYAFLRESVHIDISSIVWRNLLALGRSPLNQSFFHDAFGCILLQLLIVAVLYVGGRGWWFRQRSGGQRRGKHPRKLR